MRYILRILIFMTIASIILLPASLSNAGKKPPQPPAPPPCTNPLPFTGVVNESLSGISLPEQGLINDQAAWEELWSRIYAIMEPQPPIPSVDFSTETIVYVALGRKANSCYGVSISCIMTSASKLQVLCDDIVPGKKCFCNDVVVTPVDVVKIAKYVGPADFFHTTKTQNCP